MNPDTHILGDCQVEFDGNLMTIYQMEDGETVGQLSVMLPQPHELRKLATVIEDRKRAKDFPEDYEQKKFTDNDDVTGYIK